MSNQSAPPVVLHTRLPGRDLGPIRWTRGAPGLGNLFFPWARCVVAAEDRRLPMLWPTWPQIALGPLKRMEPPRFYTDVFIRSDRYIGGSSKQEILRAAQSAPSRLVEFEGMEGLFEPILDRHELVRDRLLEIVNPRWIPEPPAEPVIAVHVRLGDFSKPKSAKDLDAKNGNVNFRMPIEWYMHAVRLLRTASGGRLKAKVYSDGPDSELAGLLSMKGVSRAPRQAPITDLLALSQASALVASGSTFSMWASYLGRMPVVWHPGQLRQRLYRDRPELEAEVGQDSRFPEAVSEAVARMYRGAN